MTALLEINCFNGLHVAVNQQPVSHFYSQKTKALLIYLAVEAKSAHERSHLAGLLWPEFSEARARRNLSQTLTSLRKDLGDQDQKISFIKSTSQTIGLNPDANITVDVWAVEAGLTAVQKHDHPQPQTCVQCTQTLYQITSLYSGPFLDQFGAIDSVQFENWALAHRERYLQQAIDAFTQLAKHYSAQTRMEEAIQVVQHLLQLAPWRESAHRQLMRLLAQQGQRIQALNQYDVLSDVLMSELGVAPSAESDALYDDILAGNIPAISDFPTGAISPQPEQKPRAVPFQAPPVAPHFVGRTTPREKAAELLLNRSNPPKPVAIIGMGGIGKTAFAAYVAGALKSEFEDGVLWGNILSSSPYNILDSWAHAYGYDFSGLSDLESKATAVRGMLTHKNVLIVLDNVDQIGEVRSLLPSSSGCAVLLTTRNLEIASALNAHVLQLEELTSQNSLDLLVQILGEERVFNKPSEAEAASRIGHLLHHLPLAVEMAAQRLKSRPRMPLDTLAQRLENTQHRLGLSISDQAVRTSFQVSWEGLEGQTQQVFAAMAVFVGRPFNAAALTAVAHLDPFEVEDELYSLAALSLVNAVGETRYQQHPLLADFAAEMLGEDLRLCNGRFTAYYLTYSSEYNQNVAMLSPEWDNISAAIDIAFQQQQWQTVISFTDTLADTWLAYSRFHDAEQAYKFAAQAALHLDNPDQKAALAMTQLRSAEIDLEFNNYDEAWQKTQTALTYYYEQEDDHHIGLIKYFQGRILLEQGEYDAAEAHLTESQTLLAESGDAIGEVRTLGYLGWLYYESDKTFDRAKTIGQNALSLITFRKIKDSPDNVSILRLLSSIEMRNGNFSKADEYANKAIETSDSFGYEAEKAAALLYKMAIKNKLNQFEQVVEIGEVCVAILERLGNKRFVAMVSAEAGFALMNLGRIDAALKNSKKALTIYKEIADRLGYGYALRQLGDIYIKAEQVEAAKNAYQEALDVAQFLHHHHLLQQVKERFNKHFPD